MAVPVTKKRKLNRHATARENADNLYNSVTDRYDYEKWNRIISKAYKESTVEDQRYILKLFLEAFPTASRQWQYRIQLEIDQGNHDNAVSLFKKCFDNKCYDATLYKLYLNYCEMRNAELDQDRYLTQMVAAYNWALKIVGQDMSSTALWRKYINFLKQNRKALKAKHGVTDFVLHLRGLYQKVIQLPINECDKLWDEYMSWEKSLNAQLAMGWHDKYKHANELARETYLERKKLRRGILAGLQSVPTNNKHVQERNYQQVQFWKRYIDFEAKNKQNLQKTDLWRRMEFTFRQALMTMSLFPDIWLLYIDWNMRNRGVDRTKGVYVQCLKRIPDCFLIQFKYLEFLEKHISIQDAETQYETVLKQFPDQTLVYIEYLYFLRRCKSAARARNFFITTIQANPTKFWQLHVALGDIEENITKELSTAKRIYANGFKYFKENPQFVYCYVEFLMSKKDSESKQTLQEIFDNILPQFDVKLKETQKIWKMYIKFQQRQNNLNELHRVEEKRNEQQHCNRIEQLLHSIDRFSYLDLLPVSKEYRDTLIHAQQTSQRKMNTQKMQLKLNTMQRSLRAQHQKMDLLKRKKHGLSRIRIRTQHEDEDDEEADDVMPGENKRKFVDLTTYNNFAEGNDDNDGFTDGVSQNANSITMPDVEQLCAFRPGVRFLQNLNDSDQEDENDEDEEQEEEQDAEDDDVAQLKAALPTKIKELLERLPPPQQTQLLKVDRHTAMIDVDSFVTMMKLKLHADILE